MFRTQKECSYITTLISSIFGIVSVCVGLFSSVAIAEDCLRLTQDAARLRCFEARYKNTNKEGTTNRKSPAQTKEQPEDVNAVLNNLAGAHLRQDQNLATLKEQKANAAAESRWQSGRLINGCATSYCRESLAPYQEKVDQFRGQGNSPAKTEAEAELRWQFRTRANPP